MTLSNRLNTPPSGRSSRGVYLANQWYGHQAILLKHMGLDPREDTLDAKLQIGWQPGTGLDGEQGMKLEVRKQRLPYLLWGQRNIDAMKAQGITWGHAIGAPFLYLPMMTEKPKVKKAAIAFPGHSVEGYPVLEGWEAFARDFKDWCKASGLSATICLHPLDYVRLRALFDHLDVEVTCIGSIFCTDYLTRCRELILSHEAVVVDSAVTTMFYAGYLDVPVFCRGNPLRTSPHHPDDSVEKDLAWVLRQFPWANGSLNRDQAGTELGVDQVRAPAELCGLLRGETRQLATWTGPEGTDYALNKQSTRCEPRAEVWRKMLAWLGVESILEVGCGSGTNLRALRMLYPNASIIGAEPSEAARKIAASHGFAVSSASIPGFAGDDSVADLVITSGVLIHIEPYLWRTCVAELARLSRRYVFLLEYGDAQVSWNGHLGRGDFGKVLEDCGCKVIAHGEVPAGSDLGTHCWLADVGDKVVDK